MKSAISILIVDDEKTMLTLLDKILSREGYQVICAESGKSALQLMQDNTIDLVISDLKMEGMSGFDLLKVVKEQYAGVGVIIMTAYGDTYTVKDALLLGADEYITKPFKSFEISMVVERTYWRLLARSKQDVKQT